MSPEAPRPTPDTSLVSRRRLLQAGAVGAAATVVSIADIDGVAAALGLPGTPASRAAAAQALVPAAESLTLGFPAFWPMQTNAGASIVYGGNGTAWTTNNGFVAVPIELPAGTQLLRVEVNGDTPGGLATQPWYLQSVTDGGAFTLLATITATGGPGAVAGAYAGAPITFADATHYYLEVQTTSSKNRVRSAVIRYLPPGSSLRLTTPARVYDSRPGNPPAVNPKTPLTGGSARTIDTTYGGAVPAGARAVLATVTVVTRSASGFVSLYRNGIAWPGTSSINWSSNGVAIAGTQVIALDSAGAFAAYCPPGASTDLIVDVAGYLI